MVLQLWTLLHEKPKERQPHLEYVTPALGQMLLNGTYVHGTYNHNALWNVNIPKDFTPLLTNPNRLEGPHIPLSMLNGVGFPRGSKRRMRRTRPNRR